MNKSVIKILMLMTLLFLFIIAALVVLSELIMQAFITDIIVWKLYISAIVLVLASGALIIYYYLLNRRLKKEYNRELDEKFIVQNELNKLNIILKKRLEESKKENHKLNQELILTNQKAEKSRKLISAFLKNVSHEICTPLNAIMGFSQLIPNNFNNKGKLLMYSSIINQKGNDLFDTVSNLIQASRLETGNLSMDFEVFNLTSFHKELRHEARLIQTRLDKLDIDLIFAFECPDKALLSTDKIKLKNVLLNLIHNAFKYTHTGSVEVGCYQIESRFSVFYVADTGIGIEEDKIDYIFDKFTRIDNDLSQKSCGQGLGLAIVKGLLELLEGTVKVSSIPGKGSVFTLTVPNMVFDEN